MHFKVYIGANLAVLFAAFYILLFSEKRPY